MRSGEMRSLVTFQTLARTEDEGGGHSESRVAQFAAWANIDPLSGSEALSGMQLTAKVTHRITIHFQVGVSAAMRLVHEGRIFEIRSVMNPGERNQYLVLMAEEVSP
jgi:SPP1 family predicted phage head-tail adaptor